MLALIYFFFCDITFIEYIAEKTYPFVCSHFHTIYVIEFSFLISYVAMKGCFKNTLNVTSSLIFYSFMKF